MPTSWDDSHTYEIIIENFVKNYMNEIRLPSRSSGNHQKQYTLLPFVCHRQSTEKKGKKMWKNLEAAAAHHNTKGRLEIVWGNENIPEWVV